MKGLGRLENSLLSSAKFASLEHFFQSEEQSQPVGAFVTLATVVIPYMVVHSGAHEHHPAIPSG